jgi:hypothetical protein
MGGADRPLGDDRDVRALPSGLDGGSQAGAPGADNQDVSVNKFNVDDKASSWRRV